MAKRMIVMLAVTILIVGGLGFVKFRQIQTAIAQGAAFRPPPEAVTTIVAQQEQWPATLDAIGTVAAVQGVTVSADLPGTVEQILFESGHSVRAGDVLPPPDQRQGCRCAGRRGERRSSRHVRADSVRVWTLRAGWRRARTAGHASGKGAAG